MMEIKPGDICENCGEHQATDIWVGSGGDLAITRDYMQSKWCRCCVLKAQIAHILERQSVLEDLETQLTKACK